MLSKHCDAFHWTCPQVRRWLENEGFREFWPFVEADAPFVGSDLLSLSAEDWHKLIQDRGQNLPRPSVIKVRRLINLVSKLKAGSSVQNGEVVALEKESQSSDEEAEQVEKLESLSTCPYCHNVRPKKYSTDIRPERWKTFLAFMYVLLVSWITAFVMVIVHDRVPDMEKYPPLPDIILDNIPHIPWAFEMAEFTGMVLITLWFVIVLLHKHRFILMRRFFSISGTIFMLRCITMLITSLSVPGTHLECTPRPYGDIWNKLHNAYIIWTGAGMTLQGVRTCGDYMFSGHTVALTLLNFFITEYTSRRIYFLHTFTWICNVFGVFFILAAHEHYSIDVFVAFYITSRLFMYYHTLANQPKQKRDSVISYEAQRAWFWFPLFSFFESGIDGKIPNEFQWPLTINDVNEGLKTLHTWIMSMAAKKPEAAKPVTIKSKKLKNK